MLKSQSLDSKTRAWSFRSLAQQRAHRAVAVGLVLAVGLAFSAGTGGHMQSFLAKLGGMGGAAAAAKADIPSMVTASGKVAPAQESWELATFGAGCFWGTEAFFRRDFSRDHPGSIKSTAVGFMGPPGSMENPSYHQVCSGSTGHVEVLHMAFDPAKVDYETMCRFFFTFHDPTTKDRQGNDRGTQYASVIFAHSDAQSETAKRVRSELQDAVSAKKVKAFQTDTVHTAILPATTFYPAEAEHQQYLENNPRGYCNHGIRFSWNSL
mmetsp:Transcript_2221/g.6030  ORF Transcript_2221/g.6030 Transcript_2221/m.6030 type:complete len:266 (-) Transcript_2221:392-1189(-)|eukprot:CAMPEP_0185832130 /NCGR_PEP_ID=MMETSP1353-20130828/1903_1 /TAXON_ID=1077150 /ORGANISM="Erythrolobus australicus, Strain CCMP3124" /LENGTH=265 /DNA_ID=CAMNT_0028530271 /DNA_START=239 /DNA_END=1036 /DNA_ORIENTATION=+